jgi:hypothetical protein
LSSRWARLGVVVVVAGLAMPAMAQQREKHSFLSAAGKAIGDTEFMDAVKAKLGGIYENLQIMVSSCSSEGFAAEGKRLLEGNFSVAASRKFGKKEFHPMSETEVKNDKTGHAMGGGYFYHGWGAQWMKGVDTDGTRTAKQLFDYATDNDYANDGTVGPRFEFGGTGNAAKIRDGTKGSHAAVWVALGYREQFPKWHTTLTDRGYTNATIDWAFSDRGGATLDGVVIDRDADKDTLMGKDGAPGMIDKLKTDLNQDPGERKGLIVISSHGGWEERKTPKKDNPVPQQPRQGKQVTPGMGPLMSLDTEADFREFFFEDLTIDDPSMVALGLPSLLLTTSEESVTGGVSVLLDGIFAGTIDLLGEQDGVTYELGFGPSVWQSLWDAGVMNDGSVDVSFEFSSGFFTIGTEWDADLFGLDYWGVGLRTRALGDVLPSPGVAGVLALGACAAARRRRQA